MRPAAELASFPSDDFLQEVANLKATKHEHGLNEVFKRYDLTVDIPLSYVPIGLAKPHPVLKPRDFITTLSQKNKLNLLFCSHSGDDYEDFWAQWRLLQPDHRVFQQHASRLSSCIPLWIFGDEGTSQKKKALMILQLQPILGRGSSRAEDLNMIGVSTTTRFLYSVLQGRCYAGKGVKSAPLHNLISCMAEDLLDCYQHPIPVQNVPWTQRVWLITLGFKGDLQALIKVGQLQRNFMRDTATGFGPGICHLCKAGMENEPWHRTDFKSMASMKTNVPPLWAKEPALIAKLPQCPSQKPHFFRVDLFHTLHKGVYGDLAANAIASRQLC